MAKTKLFSITLADCRVDTFTVGGHGGSGKDTSNTGVRITHEPSGAIGKATESRSQLSNKRLAFRRMGESDRFRKWANIEAARLAGMKSVEQQVDDEMCLENLKIEVKTEKGWREEKL